MKHRSRNDLRICWRDLLETMTFRMEVMLLFVAWLVLGINIDRFLVWMGMAEDVATELGLVVFVTGFWIAGIGWVFAATVGDQRRAAARREKDV